MTELADLTAAQLLDEYRRHKASPVEAVESCLNRIQSIDPSLNAILELLAVDSRKHAMEATKRWIHGGARDLEGVPFGLKDLILTQGIRTTGGSRIHADYVPAESATVAQRLQETGAILLAKLKLWELGFGHEIHGTTRNPWDLQRQAGSSSSGSGAAVAGREMPIAVGTDSGGSIRIPASWRGISGLKPTLGRVSTFGVIHASWTLDHVGPMARTSEGLALMLSVIAGHDPRDANSSRVPVEDYAASIDGSIKGMRLGVPSEWFFDVVDPEVESAVRGALEVLADAGAEIVPVTIPHAHLSEPIWWPIALAELASSQRSNLGRLEDISSLLANRLVAGSLIPAVDYLQALRLRHLVQAELDSTFRSVDALMTPTTVCVAPLTSAATESGPGAMMDDIKIMIGSREESLLVIVRTTFIYNVTGVPALSIPAGFTKAGLPIGLQVAARPFDEATCLRVGHAFQKQTSFHDAVPQILDQAHHG